MTIEQLWREMEQDAEAGAGAAWLTRFAQPQSGTPLLAGLETTTRTRALLLSATPQMLPPRSEWPECRGLELQSILLGTEPYLAVRLRDSASRDVFAVLGESVIAAVGDTQERVAVGRLMNSLHRWRQFLAVASEGLSLEAQRGLWGELHFLSAQLVPALGPAAAVDSWKGGAAAHQDFQFATASIEVKTTTAKQPQSVRITSERQLDATGAGTLFLHVIVLDEREVRAPADSALGQSLPMLILTIRNLVVADSRAFGVLQDQLFSAGWLDVHAHRYEAWRWTVRIEHTFQVTDEFPRLTESDLPAGVGDVNYALSLDACEPFKVAPNMMLQALD